jgi:tRNA threonylcarbamoyladenosine biosynthesis protein TsaE
VIEHADRANLKIHRDLPDEASTEALARRLAPIARPGDVLALWGDLGVGKTVFARAFIRARGDPFEDVPSPTFTLVQVYEPMDGSDGPTYHFDLFRLKSFEETYELGIEEAFSAGVSLVEWPDRLGPLVPARRLDIKLAEGSTPNSRTVAFESHGEWRARLAEAGLD